MASGNVALDSSLEFALNEKQRSLPSFCYKKLLLPVTDQIFHVPLRNSKPVTVVLSCFEEEIYDGTLHLKQSGRSLQYCNSMNRCFVVGFLVERSIRCRGNCLRERGIKINHDFHLFLSIFGFWYDASVASVLCLKRGAQARYIVG